MRAGVSRGLSSLMGTLPLSEAPEPGRWAVGGIEPEAVAFPRSAEEAAELLGRCSQEGWTVVPAGAGTWLDAGGPAPRADLVISSRRMTAVEEYEPGDLTLTAQAGLTLGRLDELTRENRQWLAQDPPGWSSSTLGGFVSTGVAGPLVAGYGRPRDHLLGLTAVTGDGRILRPGGRVVKNVAGFDLVRLLAGSWGTLAFVTGVSVRLFPRPEADLTLLFGPGDGREGARAGDRRGARDGAPGDRGSGVVAEVVEVARALATAPVVPEALTLVRPPPGSPGSGAGGVHDVHGTLRAGALPQVAARLQGSGVAVEEKERMLRDAAGREPLKRLEGPASRSYFEALDAASSSGTVSLRLSLLPSRLGDCLDGAEAIRRLAGEAGGRVWTTAEATRGTVRIEIDALPGETGDGGPAADVWVSELRSLRRALEDRGGSLVLVRGPRELVRSVGARSETGTDLEIVRGIRREMDPAGILAPGRSTFGPTETAGAGR